MAADRPSTEPFLTRWSRRKLAATRTEPSDAVPVVPAMPLAATPPAAPAEAAGAAEAVELPPVESLTFESDFTVFLKPGVEPDVQRAALRKLLRDPRFNSMDGLDVYIDDYAKPSPLDPAVARTLAHAKALFAPARTRVNEQGYVEDVPDEQPVDASDVATGRLEMNAAEAGPAPPPAHPVASHGEAEHPSPSKPGKLP